MQKVAFLLIYWYKNKNHTCPGQLIYKSESHVHPCCDAMFSMEKVRSYLIIKLENLHPCSHTYVHFF